MLDDGRELIFSAITIEQAETLPDTTKPVELLLVGLKRRQPDITVEELKRLLTLDKLKECLDAFVAANGGAFNQGEVPASR